MPDRQVNLFITLCCQNQGYLAKSKRKRLFSFLSDGRAQLLEQRVREAFGLPERDSGASSPMRSNKRLESLDMKSLVR